MSEFDVISLTDRSVLRLEGSEATSFLQGLITQDMNLLDQQAVIYTALLTPQGKILFEFFIQKENSAYLIDCNKITCDELVGRLTMYKLRADISIEDVSENFAVVVSSEAGSDTPASPDPRYADLGTRKIVPIKETDGVSTAGAPYHNNRLSFGIADSDEIGLGQYFPHECNFDQINGVSFTKGCFVGQEVVSRMEHRSTTRNRILPFTSQTNDLERGQIVTCGKTKLGTIISYRDGRGIAMTRLDRLAKTADQNDPVLAGNAPISFFKPDWAQFELRDEKDLSR